LDYELLHVRAGVEAGAEGPRPKLD
jgi:hypothetical protein